MKNPLTRFFGKNKREEKAPSFSERDWTVFLIPGSIVLAGIFIASAVLVSGWAPTASKGGGERSAKVAPVSEKDHVFGARDADVFLIEYSDFRCGFCGRFHNTIQELLKEYEGKVAWVYRHSPYQQGAHEASVASECFAKLGGENAFWQFANDAFENQGSLGEVWYKTEATKAGLDKGAFASCYASDEFDTLFEEQTKNAQALGGQGTPFNVLLTKKGETIVFSGALPIERVRALIDQALAK